MQCVYCFLRLHPDMLNFALFTCTNDKDGRRNVYTSQNLSSQPFEETSSGAHIVKQPFIHMYCMENLEKRNCSYSNTVKTFNMFYELKYKC